MYIKKSTPDLRVIDTDSVYAGTQALQSYGLEATMPRIAVWRVLLEADSPLGAVEIKRRLMRKNVNVAISSIYLVVKRLAEVGLFSTCTIAGKAHYYLSSRHFHHRFTCSESGDEFWLPDAEIARVVEAFCQKNGFVMSDYTLSIKGRQRDASWEQEKSKKQA